MTYKEGLVFALRNNGIELKTSSLSGASKNGLIYAKEPIFHSNNEEGQWWKVNFIKHVNVNGYQLMSGYKEGWIFNWTIQVSLNNRDWESVDKQSGEYPMGNIYILNKTYKCKYLQIIGNYQPIFKDYRLAFNWIEFYGYIDYCTIKPIRRNSLQINVLLYTLLFQQVS